MSLFLRSSKLTAKHTIRSHLQSSTATSTARVTSLANPAFAAKNNNNYYNYNFVRGFRNTSVNMGVHNLASKAEFNAALSDNDVVVLDAFATWCGPCKVIAPQVVKFSETYTSAHFVKLDVDEVPDVAQELGIRAMPTFMLFKAGEKVGEVVGADPRALLAAIKTAVGEEKA